MTDYFGTDYFPAEIVFLMRQAITWSSSMGTLILRLKAWGRMW